MATKLATKRELQRVLQDQEQLMNDMEETMTVMDKEAGEWKREIRNLNAKLKRRDARIQELQASSSSSSSSSSDDDDDDDDDTDALFQNSIVSSQMQRLRQELANLQDRVNGAELQSIAIDELQKEKQESAAAFERELEETNRQCREKENRIVAKANAIWRRNYSLYIKVKEQLKKISLAYEVWQSLALELQDRFRGRWSESFGDFIDDFIDNYESGDGIDELINELKRDYVRQQYEPLPPSYEKQQMSPSKRKRNNLTDKLRL